MEEIWKLIPGYQNNEASTFGRIRSTPRIQHRKNHSQRVMGKVLSQYTTGHGYWGVKIGGATIVVHRLLWLAFQGPLTKKRPFINHKDGDKKNNKLSNLEACSHKENMHHAMMVLNRVINKSGKRALSEEDVRTIRFFAMRGTCGLIGKIYGLPAGSITKIKNGISYKYYKATDAEILSRKNNTRAPKGFRYIPGTKKTVPVSEWNPSMRYLFKKNPSRAKIK